jgi:hypothetical protein
MYMYLLKVTFLLDLSITVVLVYRTQSLLSWFTMF